MMDVAVIGGGPAGISAALTLRQRGKSVAVISADPEQSHLAKAEKINNYPGMMGMSGKEMLDVMTKQAEDAGVFFMHGRATSIMSMGESFGIAVGSEFMEAEAVILTLGISMGKPFKGETEFLGRGVSYCATCDGMLYRNKNVAVIGLCADAPEEADQARHGLFGLASEVGEVLGLYQKTYQGHSINRDALVHELGDVLWMLAEIATANGMELDTIAEENIAKLIARYPDGFDAERSLHREAE